MTGDHDAPWSALRYTSVTLPSRPPTVRATAPIEPVTFGNLAHGSAYTRGDPQEDSGAWTARSTRLRPASVVSYRGNSRRGSRSRPSPRWRRGRRPSCPAAGRLPGVPGRAGAGGLQPRRPAASGSGKTEFIVDAALEVRGGRVLVTTFTNENLRHNQRVRSPPPVCPRYTGG